MVNCELIKLIKIKVPQKVLQGRRPKLPVRRIDTGKRCLLTKRDFCLKKYSVPSGKFSFLPEYSADVRVSYRILD